MPTYHRSQRLRLVGTGPKVEQLQEGRFRLTFTCSSTNPSEAWMQGNKSQIFAAYGTLESAEMSIAGIAPRTSEAYSDMVLFRTEANPSERDLIVTLIYETATTSFVKSQDDKIDFELNGLQRVTRVTIAKTGTSLPSVTIGTTSITVDGTACKLASRSVEENDAFIQITETYLQEGTVSKSIDNVGSQLAQVITTFGSDPAPIADYVIASKEESNFSGYQTNTFRFLKPSILSVDESKNTPENKITVRVFNLASDDSSVSASSGAVVDTDTHILVSQSDQDYAGIKTSVYVFESKDYNAKSTNEFGRTVIDRVEQSASSIDLQNQSTEYTVDGVSNLRILDQRVENNDNIVNRRITKFTTVGIDDVKEDIVGSQKAIVITKIGAEPTTAEAASYSDISYDSSSDWSIAKKDNSRVNGLDVYTYTFLLDNTILSQSQDRQSSLKTEVIEVFNPKVTIDGLTIDGGSTIDGNYFLSTALTNGKNRYFQSQGDTFAKTVSYSGSAWQINQFSSIFSTSSDTNPDNANDPPLTGWSGTGDNALFNITFRQFDQTLPSSLQGLTVSHRYEKRGYSLIGIQQSNLDGIPTMRYTFAKDNSIVSVTEDKVGSQNAIVNEIFNPASESITGVDTDNVALSGYSEVDRTESNYEGVKTIRVRFLKDDTVLSKSTDSKSPLLTEVLEVFKPSSSRDTKSNFTLVSKAESNVDGIPTERYTFERNGVILSESFDLVGSQKSVVISKFQAEPTIAEAALFSGESGYTIARKEESGALGKETYNYTFLKSNVTLSTSEDKIGSQLAIVKEVFNGTPSTPSGYSIADEQISSVDGIPTRRFRFLKNNVILSTSEDKVGSQLAIVKEVFNGTPSTPSGYSIADERVSSVEGIPTRRFRFLKNNVTLSTSEDKVGSQLAIVKEVFNGTPSTPSGYSVADESISNVDGIVTKRFRFLKNNVTLSTSEDKVGSQLAIVKEVFNGTPSTPSDYIIAKEDVSSVDGIPTRRFTFLKPSVLSVSQDFTLDANQITVQAFSRTEAQVKTALSEVTSDHKLIRQSEQNHDGITTTSYVFEINTSDIINFTADDRLQVTRTIYEVFNYDYNANYTVNSSTATVNSTSVTLTSLRVDQRGTSGTFTKLTAVYTQPKIISASPVARNQYNLTPFYQYRSLSATPKAIDTVAALATPNGGTIGANAVFLEPDVSNASSPPVITQNVLDTSVDLSVSGSSALISSNQDLYNFLYPGVANLDSRFFGPFVNSSTDSTLRFNRIEIKTTKESHPITTKVRCQVYNFIQRSDQIADTDFTYDGAAGLWSPNSWATVDATIIKNYFGFSQEPSELSNVYTGYRLNGSSLRGTLTQLNVSLQFYNAVVFYNGVNYGYDSFGYFYEIKVTEPGPPDPIGKKWCLGVDIQPAFRDSSNNIYYNKQIIVTEKIPSLQRGQLTYK